MYLQFRHVMLFIFNLQKNERLTHIVHKSIMVLLFKVIPTGVAKIGIGTGMNVLHLWVYACKLLIFLGCVVN
jgi:hypothetical protein